MTVSYKICPKCGAPNSSGSLDQCDVCGIFYAKWLKSRLASEVKDRNRKSPGGGGGWFDARNLSSRLLKSFVLIEERVNVIEFCARCALWMILVIWGITLIRTNFRVTTGLFSELSFYNWVIGDVTLVFHEAGHVLFSPFGRFMGVLGGSLFQLLVPMGLALGFVFYYRKPFAGAVCAWWLGYSLMDLAPYINDAKAQELMLLTGGRGMDVPGSHDWHNLLNWTHALEQHENLASLVDTTGELMVMTALTWGGCLLYRQFRNLDR